MELVGRDCVKAAVGCIRARDQRGQGVRGFLGRHAGVGNHAQVLAGRLHDAQAIRGRIRMEAEHRGGRDRHAHLRQQRGLPGLGIDVQQAAGRGQPNQFAGLGPHRDAHHEFARVQAVDFRDTVPGATVVGTALSSVTIVRPVIGSSERVKRDGARHQRQTAQTLGHRHLADERRRAIRQIDPVETRLRVARRRQHREGGVVVRGDIKAHGRIRVECQAADGRGRARRLRRAAIREIDAADAGEHVGVVADGKQRRAIGRREVVRERQPDEPGHAADRRVRGHGAGLRIDPQVLIRVGDHPDQSAHRVEIHVGVADQRRREGRDGRELRLRRERIDGVETIRADPVQPSRQRTEINRQDLLAADRAGDRPDRGLPRLPRVEPDQLVRFSHRIGDLRGRGLGPQRRRERTERDERTHQPARRFGLQRRTPCPTRH